MRNYLACLAYATLIAAAPAGHALEPGAANPQEGAARVPPSGDRQLPDHAVKSPGFPSALAGKCRNAQDCAAYCQRHASTAGCPGNVKRRRKAAP